MLRKLLPLIAATSLSACATTNPGSAVHIDYRLPRSDVSVALSVDLTQCVDAAKANADSIKASVTLKSAVVAGPGDQLYEVAGKDLISSVIKRAVTINRDDNYILTSINMTSTDQRGQIAANVITIAAKVAAAVGIGGQPAHFQLACNATMKAYTKALIAAQTDLTTQQGKIAGAPALKPVMDAINQDAGQIAALKVLLHRDVTGTIHIPNLLYKDATLTDPDPADSPDKGKVVAFAGSTSVVFDWSPLNDMFVSLPSGGYTPKAADGVAPYKATLGADPDFGVSFSFRQPYLKTVNGLASTKPFTKQPTACTLWMQVPDARAVYVMLTSNGRLLANDAGEPARSSQLVIASQVTEPGTLCLSTGFGENRTVALNFDKYGAASQLSWSADGRTANIMSTIAGSTPDAIGVATSIQGAKLTEKKELDELQTEQALKKARACQQLLDAGATSCGS